MVDLDRVVTNSPEFFYLILVYRMPKKFSSPNKVFKNPKTVKRPFSPSPKRKDYRKVAKTESDHFSRCTFVNKETNERCKNTLGIYPQFCHIHTLKVHNLLISPSQIPNAGNGLFAGEHPFKKGDIIAKYGQPWMKVTQNTLDKRCKYIGNKCYEYVFCDDGGRGDKGDICWDGHDIRSSIARYSNSAWKSVFRHNAYFEMIRGEPYIVASRNIRAGSEIFTNYGDHYFV